MSDFYALTVNDIDGQPVPLSDFEGSVCLIVNVASQCGLTNQYDGLRALQEQHQGDPFKVLAFPCNQFGRQEPGSNEEIKAFANERYRVNFPMFDKIEVNGGGACPLYQWLKGSTDDNGDIKWNFAKFLISATGDVVGRFGPQVTPEELAQTIAEEIERARS